MIRVARLSILYIGLFGIPGCNSQTDSVRKGVSAQDALAETVAGAETQAETMAKNSELVADQRVERIEMDFMKLREDYRKKMTLGLVDLDRKVLLLEGKGKYSSGKTKSEIETSLTQIRADRFSFMNNYKALDTATSSNWESTRARLDNEWIKLVALVEKS